MECNGRGIYHYEGNDFIKPQDMDGADVRLLPVSLRSDPVIHTPKPVLVEGGGKSLEVESESTWDLQSHFPNSK
jgi:hypothetical protein